MFHSSVNRILRLAKNLFHTLTRNRRLKVLPVTVCIDIVYPTDTGLETP